MPFILIGSIFERFWSIFYFYFGQSSTSLFYLFLNFNFLWNNTFLTGWGKYSSDFHCWWFASPPFKNYQISFQVYNWEKIWLCYRWSQERTCYRASPCLSQDLFVVTNFTSWHEKENKTLKKTLLSGSIPSKIVVWAMHANNLPRYIYFFIVFNFPTQPKFFKHVHLSALRFTKSCIQFC